MHEILDMKCWVFKLCYEDIHRKPAVLYSEPATK